MPPADDMAALFRRTVMVLAISLLPVLAAGDPHHPLAWKGGVAVADDGDGDGDGDGSSGGSGGEGLGEPQSNRGDMALREVLAAGLNAQQLAVLQQRGYEVISQRSNALMGRGITLLRAPLSAFFRDPIAEIEGLGSNILADRNHYYRTNQDVAVARSLLKLAAWPVPTTLCGTGVPIGLIDTGVDLGHPMLKGASIRVLTLDRKDHRPASSAHGTAVASMLVGRDAGLPWLSPGTRLLAVDAFSRGRFGDERMEAWDLLAALDAVIRAGARVVNMSFAGNDNKMLADALDRAHKRGIVTVASVGNRGPQSPPLYPAAYEGVLAVTAVGAERRIYHRASRGDHIDLAAPGVNVPTAGSEGIEARSGTSFAAPFVTAAAAVAQRQGIRTVAGVRKRLVADAVDLGAPGHDPVYGHGLLQMGSLCRTNKAP